MGNCCNKHKAEGEDRLALDDDRPTVQPNSYEAEGEDNPAFPDEECLDTREPEVEELVAIFNHTASSTADLSFKKGDVFKFFPDKSTENWCHVIARDGDQRGAVPRSYVARRGDLEQHEWYHGGISQGEAKTLLLSDDRNLGDFLVRKSERRDNEHTLSICCAGDAGKKINKQYRIQKDESERLYLAATPTFTTLPELIKHYIGTKGCLCCVLREPCPRPPPPLPDLSSEWIDQFEIPRKTVTTQRRLGKGNFGEVWMGLWKEAIKVAVKTATPGKLSREAFLLEADIMKRLHHPNIVKLYGVCSDEPVYIVTELMENGSLLEFLRDDKGLGPHLTDEELVDMATQISRGMAYIESKNLIHRDLAARNVLVGKNHSVKIADFGLARAIEDDEYKSKGGNFPVKWTAPEAISHHKYSIKSDVWSFGIVMVELITHGSVPYKGMTNMEVTKVLDHGKIHEQPFHCPDELYDIMRTCWAKTPSGRPSFHVLTKNLEIITLSGNKPATREPVDDSDYSGCGADGEDDWVVEEVKTRPNLPPKPSPKPPPKIPTKPPPTPPAKPVAITSTDDVILQEELEPLTESPQEEAAVEAVATPTAEAGSSKGDAPTAKTMLVALYSFTAGTAEDLSFSEGDKFELLSRGNWHRVIAVASGQEGNVPSNYVAEENSHYTFAWFQPELSRSYAEHLLLADCNDQGVFLIRGAASRPGQFSLSLLANSANGREVRHYRIQTDDTGKFFIQAATTFVTLERLTIHYKENANLFCRLTTACQRHCPVVQDLSSQTQNSFEIERTSLDRQNMLGEGKFGEVWKGMWNDKVPVAIKCSKPNVLSPTEFLQEAAIMKTLQHKNLVRLYGVCSEEPIFIVTELMKFGDLLKYLRNDTYHSIELLDLMCMAQQVVQAMAYLESKSYIHRDLAARNILVSDNQIVKVADFGLARVLIDDEYTSQGSKFPVKWTALEGLIYHKFSIKSDVWSFGIVLVEIITYGETPYPGQTNAEVTAMLRRGGRHPKPCFDCPDDLYEVMRKCWDKDPEMRPSFKDLNPQLEKIMVAIKKQHDAGTKPRAEEGKGS